ncbi:MAG TPA: DUF1778 domain-containing protein [Stellaceae bacterium]|nr:DUF1778 domain-containing protein [Stellaceae bacterium]
MKRRSGTFQEFKDHTLAVARGERQVDPGEPKVWVEQIEGEREGQGAPLTRSFTDLVQRRADRDPAFAEALRREGIDPDGRKPGSIIVHVTRAANGREARPAEVIETTMAEITAVLAGMGIAADEPVTIVIEHVEDTRVIRLSPADQRAVAEGLLNPPEPTPALHRAVELYRAIMRSSGSD